MNLLLTIGLILLVGYIAGWMVDKIGLPKIIGYIATGIVFSPNTIDFIDHEFIKTTSSLMDVCLAFIAFEVGGELKWSKIKKHEKEIISITFLASLFPFVFIAAAIFLFGIFFPHILPYDSLTLLLLALLLGSLASPTAPAATLAVIHQYKAKGKVTDTILGVAALDDILGIILFSMAIAIIFIFTGGENGLFSSPLINAIYEIITASSLGIVMGFCIDPLVKILKIKSEGQWVIILFALIILSIGISRALRTDMILTAMIMGIMVVNKCPEHKIIFKILQRYTEDLIILFFFLLSGLHLDINTLGDASFLIFIFVTFRALGKYLGAKAGAKIVRANKMIQNYTAGGLFPQAGIVIGLVLSVYQIEPFKDIAEILLTTIMGTSIIHELLGPIAAKYSLLKAGEIKLTIKSKTPSR